MSPDPFDEPDEYERHLERLAEGLPRPKPLPEDLANLVSEIAAHVIVRKIHDPSGPLYMIGRFEALRSMTGGMGLVIEARDAQLDRKVAIKLWMQSGPEAQAALLAEAKTLAKLSHPNVVAVHETGTWGERVYFVMEWIEGVDGHDWMAGPRPWQEVLDVFVEAGLGLAAAHEAGIQHRDFKPANMLIGNDQRVVVADFGVADSLRALESDEPCKIVGTPTYMAPERLRGGQGDARSDQFSFCVAMWKALHGQRPYAGETREELLEAIGHGIPRHGERGRDVPRWIKQVVRKGFAERPDQRHHGMHELLQALLDGPVGGGAVDGESADEALGDVAGRLNSAPRTPAHDGSAGGEERWLAIAGDRAAPRQSRGELLALISLTSVVSAVVTAAVVLAVLRPTIPAVDPPPMVTVEDDLLEVVLAHIAADEFSEADALWHDNRQEIVSSETDKGLSDSDSLTIGRAWLNRAKELGLTDSTKGDEALEMARQVAAFVTNYGSDSKAKRAGGKLIKEIEEFNRSRPPARSDATAG